MTRLASVSLGLTVLSLRDNCERQERVSDSFPGILPQCPHLNGDVMNEVVRIPCSVGGRRMCS